MIASRNINFTKDLEYNCPNCRAPFTKNVLYQPQQKDDKKPISHNTPLEFGMSRDKSKLDNLDLILENCGIEFWRLPTVKETKYLYPGRVVRLGDSDDDDEKDDEDHKKSK